MSDERLGSQNTIEIGNERYGFTTETQQFLKPSFSSTYPKDKSFLIIDEPHDSSEGQFYLFKGLESFLDSNPGLAQQTIFLSEGTTANKPISVAELVNEDSSPSDETIHEVLRSHLITGYMAYEWKHQQGIPIIGTEHEGLYTLSQRWASMCRENPKAVFQHRKYTDGTEHDIPLEHAWAFAIAARNKYIVQTFMEATQTYKNPMLFVAVDHVRGTLKGMYKGWVGIVKKNILHAQHSGMFSLFEFEPKVMGEPGERLELGVPEDSEMFDINHYLEQTRIGYTFLEPTKMTVTPEDKENYKRVFHNQAHSRYE